MPSSLEPFSGKELLAAPPQRVLAVLSDPGALAAAMPGLVSSEPGLDRSRARRCVVRPAFSFLSGTIRITVTVDQPSSEGGVTAHIGVQGIGLSMEILSQMKVAAGPEQGSTVDWQARVTGMRGLLSAVPSGLIRGAAESVIREGWASLRKTIDAERA